MATSGTLKTNTTYDSYFWVEWSQKGDQVIANNRTQIAWSVGVYCGHSFYSNAIKMSAVTINGTKVYSGGTYSDYSKGKHTIASGTMWINHDANGTKTFSISSFTGWLYSNHNYSSNGGNFTLDTIPRQATITSAPNFTDLENPTLYYSNPAGNSATELMACISFTGVGDNIPYRAITKTGTSYKFELTDAERNTLRTNTSSSSRYLYFYLRTKFGTTTFHEKQRVTFSIVKNNDSIPSITMTKTLDNSSLPSQFGNLCIQGKSRYDVKLSATGKYGASITSLYATLEGRKYNSTSFKTNVIQSLSNTEIVAYTEDTREFPNSVSQPITVIPYSKPLVVPSGSDNAIVCYRSDGNGKRVGSSTSVWIKAKMTFYSVEGKNQCALQWRMKESTEEWKDSHLWVNLLPKGSSEDTFNALISNTVFDVKKSYTVQLMAIDDVGEQDIKTFEIPTEDVALHLGKGGKNVTIGEYCDYTKDYTFTSEWDTYLNEGVFIKKQPLNDHVVEQGTTSMGDNGTWYWSKWASGKAECYGVKNFGDVGVTNAWGVLYESAPLSQNFPSGLFVAAPDHLDIRLRNASNAAMISQVYGGTRISSSNTGNFSLVRPNSITMGDVEISFNAIGRWK